MTAINVIVSVLELLLFLWYAGALEPRRWARSRWIRAAVGLVIYYPWYLIHLDFENLGQLKLFALVLVLLPVLCRLDIPHTLFIASSFACLIQTCGILGFFILRFLLNLQPAGSFMLPMIALEAFLLAVKGSTLWLHRRYLRELSELRLSPGAVLLSLLPLAIVAVAASVYLYAFDTAGTRSQRLFFAFLITILGVFVYFSIFSNTRRVVYEHRDAENRRIQEALKNQLTLTDAWREREGIVRRMNHDMKNHLLALDSLSSADEMHSYIHTLLGEMDSVPHLEHTGCPMADAVINRKLPDFQAIGAEVKIVADLHGFTLGDSDCCSIFANALDNAAEALRLCPEGQRWLTVKAYRQSGLLVLKFTNFCPEEPRRAGSELVSNKEGDHGLGLKSIRYSAARCGGRVETDWADGRFTLTVLFPERQVFISPGAG